MTAWLEDDEHPRVSIEVPGIREPTVVDSVWPSARRQLLVQPQPKGAPASRLPLQDETLGGAVLPGREVDLALAHSWDELHAMSSGLRRRVDLRLLNDQKKE